MKHKLKSKPPTTDVTISQGDELKPWEKLQRMGGKCDIDPEESMWHDKNMKPWNPYAQSPKKSKKSR